MCAFRHCQIAHQPFGFLLLFLDQPLSDRRLAAGEQVALRVQVQLFKQLAFPGVPDFRAGAANVGDGQEIEGGQVSLVHHRGGKGADHVRVGNVLFLGDAGHQQVMAYQPDDQFALFRGEAVTVAEGQRVNRAALRVVAAAPLGDVVKQGGDVDQPGLVEIADELTAQRVFVGEFAGAEATQVAQHLQGVLVDGVGVKQVVLHLSDDLAEFGQVGAQDVELVHAPHFMHDAAFLLEDGDELRLVQRIGAEVVVDQLARAPQRPDRPRRQPDQFRVLLHEQEGFENRVRCGVEDVFMNHVKVLPDVLEALVDRQWRLFRNRVDGNTDVLQQNAVDLGDRFGDPVVLLHQLLAGAARRGVGETELFRDERLIVEQQPVFMLAGVQVQVDAQPLQKAFAACQPLRFRRGDEAMPFQVVPAIAVTGRLGDPQDVLQVAQSAGAFLAVGFEAVRRLMVTPVTLFLFQPLPLKEGLRVDLCPESLKKSLGQRGVAGQQAGFHQGGLHRQIPGGITQALFRCAHAMRDFQTNVPKEADQGSQMGGQRLVGFFRQQQEQVDIRSRPQFTASVAAGGEQGQGGRNLQRLPAFAQHFVDQATACLEQGQRIRGLKKALLEACLFVLKSGSAADAEFVALREVATHCAALIHSGAGRAPADRVSTS